jgi:hypothetical protein
VRSFAAELLADAGFEVIEARNAQEALMKLQHEDGVHVLFTDVDMPPGKTASSLRARSTSAGPTLASWSPPVTHSIYLPIANCPTRGGSSRSPPGQRCF